MPSAAEHLQDAEKVRQQRSRIAQRLNVRQRVRFASSLAAALLDSLFAHPASHSDADMARELIAAYCTAIKFFRSLLNGHFTFLSLPRVAWLILECARRTMVCFHSSLPHPVFLGSHRTVLHCAHRATTALSWGLCEQEGLSGGSLLSF